MSISLKSRLELVYFLFYSSLACYFPFLTVYFRERGLTFVQIGIVFAVQAFTSIIAQPLWGFFTDKYLSKKKAVIINLICCSIAIFIFIPANSFFLISAAVAILIAFQSAITPISDSYCYEIIEHNQHLQFGRIRLVGSLSFALVALLLGKVILYTGINIIFVFYSFFMISTIFFFSGINHKESSTFERPSLKDLISVLKNYRFNIFVLSVMILNIALGSHGGYIPILIEKTGGDVSNIGMVWFIQAISELPIFFLGNKIIKKYGELNVYLVAIGLYIVRMYANSISNDYNAVIAIQIMQGITYPIYLVSVMQYVNSIVPSKVRASGMTLISSLGFGLGGFIGSISGGIILERYDIFILYKAITIFCIIALVVGIILKLKEKRSYQFN